MDNKKLLQDKEGNTSSKRVAGYIGLGAALVLTVVATVTSSSADITGMLYAWLGFSSACLIGGVFERKS